MRTIVFLSAAGSVCFASCPLKVVNVRGVRNHEAFLKHLDETSPEPVKLEGVTDSWQAANWTLDSILEKLGDVQVWARDLRDSDPILAARTATEKARHFLAGSASELAVFETHFCNVTRAMHGFYRVPSAFAKNVYTSPILGLGRAGAGVGFHQADAQGFWASWIAQVYGSTTWALLPPKAEPRRPWPWPLADDTSAGPLFCTLNRGEGLFVPRGFLRAWRGEDDVNLVFGFQGSSAPMRELEGLLTAVISGDVEALTKAFASLPAGADVENFLPPCVHHALQAGHMPILKKLKLMGAGFDDESPTGSTHIHYAATAGQADAIRFAIENGADPSVKRDSDGSYPIHMAAFAGHAEVVEVLLKKAKTSWKQKDSAGKSALHFAATHGHTSVAAKLLERHSQLLASQDKLGMRPLHWAAEKDQAKMVQFLLDARASLEAANKDGDTPLHRATMSGHQSMVSKLLHLRANLEAKRSSGQTAVHTAAYLGDIGMLELLKGHGAELAPEAGPGQYSPEGLAASAGHQKVLDFLQQAGAGSPDEKKDNATAKGPSSAHAAVQAGHVAMLKSILKVYSKEDKKKAMAIEGLPSLMHDGVQYGHKAVTDFFLDFDIMLPNRAAMLQTGANAGHVEMVDLLVKRGFDVDTKDAHGDRPLLLAASQGHIAVGKRLIALKAELEHMNEKDISALHMAVMKGDDKFARLLLESGAKTSPKRKAESHRDHIHVAAAAGHAPVVGALLDHRADLQAQDAGSFSPLFLAAEQGHVKVLQELVRRRADLEQRMPLKEKEPSKAEASSGPSVGPPGAKPPPTKVPPEATVLSIAGSKGHVAVLKHLAKDWEVGRIMQLAMRLGEKHGKEVQEKFEKEIKLKERAQMAQNRRTDL